jgi:hypothetical protein
VSAPIGDAEAAREALREVGVKAALRGTGIRFACHVYTTPDHVRIAAEAIRPFVHPASSAGAASPLAEREAGGSRRPAGLRPSRADA